MAEISNAYKTLNGKHKSKWTLERPRHIYKYNIKMIL
jgi:hypothetical protein